MPYIYSTGELYPSNRPCYVTVTPNETFTVYEESTAGMAATKIFTGSSYSGEFNLSTVVDVAFDISKTTFTDINDSSYGGFTRLYRVEKSDGTNEYYRFFYSPFGGNYTTTDRTFTSKYEPIIREGTYTWTLRLNADGLSSLTCNFATPQSSETTSRAEKCGEWWILYFLDERALPSYIYLDGKVTVSESKYNELSITTHPYQDVDADDAYKKELYSKMSKKKFEVNTGYMNADKMEVMERIIKSPSYMLVKMKGDIMWEHYYVNLTSSQLQTSPNARLNQNNLKLSFESIYENIIR